MDKNLYKRVVRYKTTVAIIKEMVIKSIISEYDYNAICAALASKYGLSPNTIYSEIDKKS